MAAKRRLGILDLGTNSVRFDVHRIGPGARTELLKREKVMVRLGEGVFLRGTLDSVAKARTLEAMQRFRRIAEDLSADTIVAFGTAALREAEDGMAFVEEARRKTGIAIRIISGEEEAKLIAEGVLEYEEHARGRVALIDIGGGSTEITVCRNKEILHCNSFPIGVARLQQLFLKTIPPKRTPSGESPAVDEMRHHIRSVLLPTMIGEDWPKVKRLIGSSGTVRAVSKIMKAMSKTRVIHRLELKRLVKRMTALHRHELLAIPGMEPKRVDLIVSGTILLDECMEAFGSKQVYPTQYALRDGILLEELRGLDAVPLPAELDLFPLYVRAGRFGCQDFDLKQLVANAELLFDRTQALHGLEAEWKDYLLIACIFRDTGWSISPIEHEAHSFYILKNIELPLSEPWEVELVAQLCLRQEKGKWSPSPEMRGAPKRAKEAFDGLLSLFRVVEALGPAHQTKIPLQEIQMGRGMITLVVGNAEEAEIVQPRLEKRKALFERIFARGIIVKNKKVSDVRSAQATHPSP